MLLSAAAGAMAQSNRTRVKLLMPLVFDKQKVVNDTLKSPSIHPEKSRLPIWITTAFGSMMCCLTVSALTMSAIAPF